MITRLADLAVGHSRRTLLIAGAVFLLAAAFGAPVVSILKSENSDFQDPRSQNQQVLKVLERATGQTATYGLVALVPSRGDVRADMLAQRESAHVAALLSAQPGFQRMIDYPSTRLPELVSRDGRQTLVLAAFAKQEDFEPRG